MRRFPKEPASKIGATQVPREGSGVLRLTGSTTHVSGILVGTSLLQKENFDATLNLSASGYQLSEREASQNVHLQASNSGRASANIVFSGGQ